METSNKMSILRYVSKTADMRRILAHYGYRLNTNGFMRCPFHEEKTASFKLYADNTRWHCFGCGADGDAVDFVKRAEGINTTTAVGIVNGVCSLGLPVGNQAPSLKQMRKMKELTEQLEGGREALKKAKEELERLTEKLCTLDRIITAAAPKTPDEEISGTYAEALRILPYYDYLYDCGGYEEL